MLKKVIIFYNKNDSKKIKILRKKKIKLVKIPLDLKGELNLKKVLKEISKIGFSRVFLECGETLASSFLNKNLVNDFKILKQEKIIHILNAISPAFTASFGLGDYVCKEYLHNELSI